jgi:hypothetical protein
MARLMYTRSLVPSDASMSLRISSSDNAIASTSASLRWAYSVTSAMATLHHIQLGGGVMRRVRKPGGLNAGGETGLRKSHAKTHSVPSPRRRLHRRRLNVSITTRGRIIGTLRHPNRYPHPDPGALIAPHREASRWQQTGPHPHGPVWWSWRESNLLLTASTRGGPTRKRAVSLTTVIDTRQ